MRGLDFVIIGAQKSGTTSLFRYLQSHPTIYMPPDKEAPYFDREENLQRGWGWYVNEFFRDSPTDHQVLWGTVTPQYLSDPRVPQRIADRMPEIRLIALLRNPITRAHSHYRMVARWGNEEKTFSEAIDYLLEKPRLERARFSPDRLENQNMTYVVWGEYGRLLAQYRRLFAREQILILFTEDLAQDPTSVVRSTLSHLGLEESFIPPNINKRYHVGGDKKRIRGLEKVLNLPVWRTLAPRRSRNMTYWLRQWNTIATPPSETIDPITRQTLIEFYRSDVDRLSENFELQVPWIEWHDNFSSKE